MTARRSTHLLLVLAAATLALGVAGWLLLPIRYGSTALVDTAMQAIWLATFGVAAAAWCATHATDGARIAVASLLAAIAPLAMVPLAGSGRDPWAIVGLAVPALAAVPLAGVLIARIGTTAWAVRPLQLGVVAATVVGLAAAWTGADATSDALILRFAAVTGMLAVLTVLAVGVLSRPRPGTTSHGRTMAMLTAAAAGVLPMITNVALLPIADWPLFVSVAAAAGATTLLLARVAIRPLAQAASRADEHRDLVIAASEAERTRLAQALHDGPLGDITLLVQRLDATGDADNAAIARAIATDLRTIGNDLQLPILDDLGAGPALEWLGARVARRAGADVRVEVETTDRPPRAVELVVYRVAQEAIVNAVKHGAAPILVRYRAGTHEALLTIDDAGPGLPEAATATARSDGRLGLVSMAQRAEAVGAELVLDRSAAGGAHVGLRWSEAGA